MTDKRIRDMAEETDAALRDALRERQPKACPCSPCHSQNELRIAFLRGRRNALRALTFR